jgi:chemotaxis protein MotD
MPSSASSGRDHNATDPSTAAILAAQAGDTGQSPRPHLDIFPLHGMQALHDSAPPPAPLTAQPAAATVAATTPVPIEGLAVEIAARAQAGRNRFEIRLDPPELGRIEVRLDIDRSGLVTSRLTVERAETLEVLRRDAHELERALNQAGLKTGEHSLQFALRDQGFAGRDSGREAPPARPVVAEPDPVDATQVRHAGYGRLLQANGRLDIRV